MNEQHTSGPWRLNAHTREIFTDADRTICRAHLDSRTRSKEESVANARLIAAAPDAVTFAKAVRNESDQPHLRAMAREWLAKATGAA